MQGSIFKAKIFCVVLFAFILVHNASASYQVYFMNNAPSVVAVKNDCGNFPVNTCRPLYRLSVDAFQRTENLILNYANGLEYSSQYASKIYFGNNGDFFSVKIHKDLVGSHLSGIDVFADGELHNLLNDHNAKHEAVANHLGVYTIQSGALSHYKAYVDVQKDRSSAQGIDDIYLSISKDPVIFKSLQPHQLTVVTYNIQAFPNYMGLVLDLNKANSRIAYLSRAAYLKSADLVVFEEAWDKNIRTTLKHNLHMIYPYSLDPIPSNTHYKPLNSGLLVLSKYPITRSYFLNYQDYQSLTDADALSNKGALYFQINKQGEVYNFIASHTQAQDDTKAVSVRREEFSLIKHDIINNKSLDITANVPFILVGDLNTNLYDRVQFSFLKKTLNISEKYLVNTTYTKPKYSYASKLNLMISKKIHESGMYDYIVPINGYVLPHNVLYQITPIRAVDDNRMYQSSKNIMLYNYGDIEISDHFMVQAKLEFN